MKKPLNPKALNKAVQKVVRKKCCSAKVEDRWDLESAINVQDLKRIMAGNKSLLDNCLQTFESTYPPQIKKITTCIEKNEYHGLKESAHRLKGMLKYLAAHNAVKLAEQLESMGIAGNAAGADITVQALNNECLKIVDSIKQVLKEFS